MISDYIGADSVMGERAGEGMYPTCDVWGIVEEASDETQKGNLRVRVKTMQDKQDMFDNVPVLTCYGGGSYGVFCLPETGDVVRLSFLGGDFRHPVVTGSRFPADSEFIKKLYDKDNLKKGLQTPGGSAMIFSGEKGKERIEICGPEKMRWELDEEGQQVAFGDQEGKNEFRADKDKGEAVVTAEKEIRLECGESSLVLKKDGSIILNGKAFKLEARTIELEGKGKIQVSGQELKLESTTGLTLTAKGQIKVESKGVLKLSGAMINLN